MKLIITVLIGLSIASAAFAGTAKISWDHDGKDTSGLAIQMTKYRVYWAQQGQPLSSIIDFGPPAPGPWKTTGGVGTFSKTMTVASWVAGQTICFEVTAFSDVLESGHSQQVCKVFTGTPSIPTHAIVN